MTADDAAASTLASSFPRTPRKLSDSAVDAAMVYMMAGRANFMVGDVETRVAEGVWRKR
jgi:hypothetical protein